MKRLKNVLFSFFILILLYHKTPHICSAVKASSHFLRTLLVKEFAHHCTIHSTCQALLYPGAVNPKHPSPK